MRSTILILHRWVGITVLLFLAIAAITGSIIAFGKELDRVILPEWNTVVPQGERLALNDLVARVQETYPGTKVTYVKLEEDDSRSFRFLASRKPAEGEGSKMISQHVFVNPYTGEILGTRRSGTFALDRPNLIPFITKIHYTLFLGDFGKWFMGFIALAWLLDHFGAVYLAFPSLMTWKKSFQVRWKVSGYKLHFDLHRASSLWFLPVLFVLALTSVELNLKAPFVWVVSQFSPINAKPCICKVDPNAEWSAHNSSWDHAVTTASQHFPEMKPGSVMFYPDEVKFRVSMKGPDDISDSGMTYVYVNAATGEPLMVHKRNMESSGDTFLAWMYPLHNGRAFGLAGQIIVCLSGLIVTLVSVTGLLIYVKKLRGRMAVRAQRPKGMATLSENPS